MTSMAIVHRGETTLQAKRRLEAGYKLRRNKRVRQLFLMIAYGTPIRTGWASGNWRITTGGPVTQPIDRYFPDNAIAQELAALDRIHHFANVYISNGVPYIGFLENGTSNQAPQGIVRVQLSAFKAMNADVS